MDAARFVKRIQELLMSCKVKEAIDYAYSTAEKGAGYTQMKLLCLYNAADIYYFKAGDGECGKAWCAGLLDYLDEHLHIMSDVPSLREAMEDIYVKMCEVAADSAVSYEEFFLYMNKITAIRPHTDLQQKQIALVDSMQDEGQSWCNNMLYLAARYAGTNVGAEQSNTEFGSAASLYGLMLQNRRKLRIGRTDLKMVMSNYSACIGNLLLSYAEYCRSHSLRVNPGNYLFMIDKATSIIDEAKEDLLEPEAGKEELSYLAEQKEALIQLGRQNGFVTFDDAAPNASGIEDLPSEINRIMSSNLAPAGLRQSVPAKAKTSGISVLIQLAVAGAAWYLALGVYQGQWWLIIIAVFLSLVTIGKLFTWSSQRNK